MAGTSGSRPSRPRIRSATSTSRPVGSAGSLYRPGSTVTARASLRGPAVTRGSRCPRLRSLPVVVGGFGRGGELRRTRCASERRLGVDGQHHPRPGTLVEVEVSDQIAKDLLVLTDIWSRVRSTVCRGVEALPVEEVIFDELVIGIEAQGSDGRRSHAWHTG